jgi:SpoVK/Ycf46/Vps4 family AAA+-type ATPase
LLDDADDFCSTRGDDSSAAGQTLNALKVGMLHLMDIAQDVPIVLTTNRLASLDSAIHRRIVEHIEFPLPDEAARTGIISGFFESLGIPETSLTEDELTELVSASHGFSPAELALAVVDGVCEIESGKGILLCDAIQNSIRARNDMRARAVQPAVERPTSRAVVRSRSSEDSEKS